MDLYIYLNLESCLYTVSSQGGGENATLGPADVGSAWLQAVGWHHDDPLYLSSSLHDWVPYAKGRSTRGRCMEVDDLLWNPGSVLSLGTY